MKNAITKWYRMLVIIILAAGCAGFEPAAQFSVKVGTVVLAMPGGAIPPSTATTMRTATKIGATAPGGAAGLSQGELKYRLLDTYSNFFFCDPDRYPLVISDEQERAIARFPEIQKDTEKYQAILKHAKLEGVADLSDSQKLIVYQEFKKLEAITIEPLGEVYRFRLSVLTASNSDFTNGLIIEGTITKTGEITVSKSERRRLMCPTCLATNTLIDTPSGPKAVQDLQEGMNVWTLDGEGRRVAARVVHATRVRAPTTHRVVRLRLDDGRKALASPGHPTVDGRTLAQLQPGDALDGARVLSARRIRYANDYTYDILPSGSTSA